MLPKYLLIITFLLSTVSCSQFLKFEDLCKIYEIGNQRFLFEQFLESKGFLYEDYSKDKSWQEIKYTNNYRNSNGFFSNCLLEIAISDSNIVRLRHQSRDQYFHSHYTNVINKYNFEFLSDYTDKNTSDYVVFYQNKDYRLIKVKGTGERYTIILIKK